MKKRFSLLFLLLASIVILVHAVIPHHHHNRICSVVVNLFDCEWDLGLYHAHDGHSHKHHTACGGAEECLLSDFAKSTVRVLKDNSGANAGKAPGHETLHVSCINARPVIIPAILDYNHVIFANRGAGNIQSPDTGIPSLRAPPLCQFSTSDSDLSTKSRFHNIC